MNHNSHIWSHCLQPRHFTHWVYSDVVHSIFPFIGHAGVPGFGALFPDENGNFDEMWSCSSCCSHNGSRNPRQCWNLMTEFFSKKWAIHGLNVFIFVFSTQLTVNKCLIKVCRWLDLNLDLWCRRQPLYQLSHNHYPKMTEFILKWFGYFLVLKTVLIKWGIS